ncbi:hypothetical protein HMPREF1868_01439 [Olsenella sp. DNF00959]|nr:hypothetical protein HMPREF1868_01439 [Olsenella sp. DNF00959]
MRASPAAPALLALSNLPESFARGETQSKPVHLGLAQHIVI